MVIYRAKDMLAAIAEHVPALAAGLATFDLAAQAGDEASAVREGFAALPSVSIDVGVMEKVADLAVVIGDFGWSDIGSWQAAYELAAKDAHGNAGQGGAAQAVTRFLDARNNLVVASASPGKAVVLLGVHDLVVVDTPDALLVLPRERSQDVRQCVDALSAERPDLV